MKLTRNIVTTVFVALGAAALGGCSDGTATGATATPPTYHADIAPLVDAKCGSCHVAGGIAPFALSTYDEVKAMKGALVASVQAKTMPPWSPDDACNVYKGDRSLTDAQIDLLSQWADDGAPEGDAAANPAVVATDNLTLSRVDLELSMPEPYTPVVSPDEYRCFAVDWPNQETTFVTGLGVEPGHTPIVHHVIAFLAKPNKVAGFQALDDADPGPGWSCYGGPGGDTGGGAGWVGAWAPGTLGSDFPAGTGIEIPPGSKLIMQLHYNTLSAPAAPDQTKLLIRTEKTVEKRAALMPFTDIAWVKNQTMTIPAHTNDVKHETTSDPTTFAGIITNGAISSNVPLTVYQPGLHMHTRGKSIKTSLLRADGSESCLLDIPKWNFHWQGGYFLDQPLVIEPGDHLSLQCTWDNPEAADLNWGEGTGDEMCLGVYYLSE